MIEFKFSPCPLKFLVRLEEFVLCVCAICFKNGTISISEWLLLCIIKTEEKDYWREKGTQRVRRVWVTIFNLAEKLTRQESKHLFNFDM